MKKGALAIVICLVSTLFASQKNDAIELLIQKFEKVKPGSADFNRLSQELSKKGAGQDPVLNRLSWQQRQAIEHAGLERKLEETQKQRPNKLQKDIKTNTPHKINPHPQNQWQERAAKEQQEAERVLIKMNEERQAKMRKVQQQNKNIDFDPEQSVKDLAREQEMCELNCRQLSAQCNEIKQLRKRSQHQDTLFQRQLQNLKNRN